MNSVFVIALVAALIHGITLLGAQKKDCQCEKRPQGPKAQIISAVENCDVETVTSLIRNGASIESRDDEGNTLLKYSIEKKCESLVDFLLASGANANSPSIYGRTPFMSAVSSGSIELVQRLIASGSDVNFKDKFRQPALFYANELAMVKILVEAGADVNAADHIKMTPLMHAVMGCDRTNRLFGRPRSRR